METYHFKGYVNKFTNIYIQKFHTFNSREYVPSKSMINLTSKSNVLLPDF